MLRCKELRAAKTSVLASGATQRMVFFTSPLRGVTLLADWFVGFWSTAGRLASSKLLPLGTKSFNVQPQTMIVNTP